MIVAMNSPSCSDDHSDTTTTTASTMSIGDNNKHEKHVWQVSLSALESKIMHVVSENTRLRSDVKRQASAAAKTIADLTERLERLEKAAESTTDPVVEARLRSLERIVIKGEAPRSRHNLHSSLPDLSCTASVASAASAATRTRARSRSRSRAMSNRVATAKAVADALESSHADYEAEDVSMSLGLDYVVDSSEQQPEVGKGDEEFPILSSPMRSSKKLSAFLSSEEDKVKPVSMDSKSVSGRSVASRRRAARQAEAPASPMKKLAPLVSSPVKAKKSVATEEKAQTLGKLPVVSPLTSPVSPVKQKATLPDGKMRELCQPFTPEKLARAQAQDQPLTKQLDHGGMYPSFCMSTQSVNDNASLYLFRKSIYVPEPLRQATMEYYYRQAGGQHWGSKMCRHKIWPTIDSDITNFRPGESL